MLSLDLHRAGFALIRTSAPCAVGLVRGLDHLCEAFHKLTRSRQLFSLNVSDTLAHNFPHPATFFLFVSALIDVVAAAYALWDSTSTPCTWHWQWDKWLVTLLKYPQSTRWTYLSIFFVRLRCRNVNRMSVTLLANVSHRTITYSLLLVIFRSRHTGSLCNSVYTASGQCAHLCHIANFGINISIMGPYLTLQPRCCSSPLANS